MKCIRCGHDSKFKERGDHTCPKCRGTFAFEPRTGDPVTDVLFQKAIVSVSGDGKIRWGVEHLYYEICRRKKGRKAPLAVIVIALALTTILLGSVVFAGQSFVPLGVFGLFAFVVTCV